MGQGKRLNAMLFIEGRSVPFVGATCHSRVGQPSSASIEMVPLTEINDILPRSMVHVFVKDFTSNLTKKPWILAFEGEVYGFSMGKNPSSRTFNMLCMGLSNYWDSAKQSYMNMKTAMSSSTDMLLAPKIEGEAKRENMPVIKNFGSLKAYLVRIITKKLNDKGEEAYLEAILDIISGVEEVNPFFRYSGLRYRLSDRIGFASSGNIKDIFDFTNKENFFEALTGRGGGGVTTIRQLMNMLMGLIFHQFVSPPFPSKIDAPKGVKGIGKKKNKTIGSFLFKPDSFMLPPPRCNVIYPDQYNTFGFTRNFFHEVSRVDFRPSPLAANIALGVSPPSIFQNSYHAPGGYGDYMGAKDSSETTGEQHKNAGVKGNFGDKIKDSKSTDVLKEFHYMSYEEILKGIFSDQGNMMPSAQALTKVATIGAQSKFYQRATDFMFNKKRLASRRTSLGGPLNFAPVPGFPILVIDDSEAEQNVLGNLDGITHSFSANGGGFTQYEVSFGRLVKEKDLWDGDLSEPPIPPWYDESVFGKRRKVSAQDYENLPKSEQADVKGLGYVNDFGNSDLGNFYATLLGNSKEDAKSYLGSSPITDKKFPNVVAATTEILRKYRLAKKNGYVDEHISKYTTRNYTQMNETFEFLGATINANQKWATYGDATNIIYKGARFDGGFVNEAEEPTSKDLELKTLFGTDATVKRRAPITAYRNKLLRERGFRG